MKLKIMILVVVLVIISVLEVKAIIPIKELKLAASTASANLLTRKGGSTSNVLTGAWSIGDPENGLELQITDVLTTSGITVVRYNLVSKGAAFANQLVGHLIGNKLFFTIPSINGYYTVLVTFIRGFTAGVFLVVEVTARDCIYVYTHSQAGDIYECAFLPAEATDIGSGTITK